MVTTTIGGFGESRTAKEKPYSEANKTHSYAWPFFLFFNKERCRRTEWFIDYHLWKYKLQIGTEKSREIQLSPYILHEGPSWSTSTCPPTYTITFVYLPRIAKNWNIAYPFTAIPRVIPLYTYKLTYFYMKYVVILFIV